MTMIRAIVTDPTSPHAMSLREISCPVPAPHEALVRVQAFSLNLGEVRRAQYAEAGAPIGWDVVGVVEQAAADGSGPPASTRVVGIVPTGAWAELVAVATNALAVLPDQVTNAHAATLPVAGLTALHAVERGGPLLAQPVLVTGASGGVGLFACQLAHLSGGHVVALIRRPDAMSIVEESHADRVIVSESVAAAHPFGPYRLVVESVGGAVLAGAMGMLAPDGTCVCFGASESDQITFPLWSFAAVGRVRLYGLVLFQEFIREPAARGLERLVSLLSVYRLHPSISLEAPWTDTPTVASQLLDRRIIGKAVLHIE